MNLNSPILPNSPCNNAFVQSGTCCMLQGRLLWEHFFSCSRWNGEATGKGLADIALYLIFGSGHCTTLFDVEYHHEFSALPDSARNWIWAAYMQSSCSVVEPLSDAQILEPLVSKCPKGVILNGEEVVDMGLTLPHPLLLYCNLCSLIISLSVGVQDVCLPTGKRDWVRQLQVLAEEESNKEGNI